jgi:hypothetical protein
MLKGNIRTISNSKTPEREKYVPHIFYWDILILDSLAPIYISKYLFLVISA